MTSDVLLRNIGYVTECSFMLKNVIEGFNMVGRVILYRLTKLSVGDMASVMIASLQSKNWIAVK